MRALLIPGLALAAALLLHADAMLRTIIVGTLALPMGMNMVVYPEAFGGDGLSAVSYTHLDEILEKRHKYEFKAAKIAKIYEKRTSFAGIREKRF